MKALLISMLGLMLAGWSSSSATDAVITGSVKTKAPAQRTLKVSRDGFAAMRAIRAARIAIFDGEPKLAAKMLDKAKSDLDAAAKDDTKYVVDVKALVNGKTAGEDSATMKQNWIPIDGQIALADTFVPSPENAEHIKKANEHFQHGRSKEALEELRLGNIEVSFTRILMPLRGTTEKVAEALHLMGDQKYYEANLALKAAEDAMIVDSVSLIELPQTKPEKKAK
jgi:hypothetical protein